MAAGSHAKKVGSKVQKIKVTQLWKMSRLHVAMKCATAVSVELHVDMTTHLSVWYHETQPYSDRCSALHSQPVLNVTQWHLNATQWHGHSGAQVGTCPPYLSLGGSCDLQFSNEYSGVISFKSINIWKSYCKNTKGSRFYETQCSTLRLVRRC